MKKSNLDAILETVLMVVLSVVLGSFKIFRMPLGGAVTMGASCPIIILSFRRGIKFSVVAGFLYACLQIMFNFQMPPVTDFISVFLVILLDYIIPYLSLGFANLFVVKNKTFFATFAVLIIRYISCVCSGVIIWSGLLPVGVPVWEYSLLYNAFYIIPEMIITSVICELIYRKINLL